MGCSSCSGNSNRVTKVTTKNVVSKNDKVSSKKPKPATKFMHVKVSGVNMKRAFNVVQARAQKRAKRKAKQI